MQGRLILSLRRNSRGELGAAEYETANDWNEFESGHSAPRTNCPYRPSSDIRASPQQPFTIAEADVVSGRTADRLASVQPRHHAGVRRRLDCMDALYSFQGKRAGTSSATA